MGTVTAVDDAAQAVTAWSPLRLPVFRMLWIATLASNVGTWMHDVGAGWLMTSLSSSALMVALVQTATTLPIFLLALPAGALADIVDRRRYLLVVQVWMAAVAGLLAVLTLGGLTTAWTLVGLTFAMGVGTAMMMPAWAAVTPELVPRPQLQSAIALNSLGINVARAIGPALAGLVVAQLGTGAVFVPRGAGQQPAVRALFRGPALGRAFRAPRPTAAVGGCPGRQFFPVRKRQLGTAAAGRPWPAGRRAAGIRRPGRFTGDRGRGGRAHPAQAARSTVPGRPGGRRIGNVCARHPGAVAL
jgi:MFS family permease